jgi:hypothetical protein
MEESSQSVKQRIARRCPFVASVEVTDLSSETQQTGTTTELGIGGCYVRMRDPLPKGALVQLRIFREQGVLETKARVVYSHDTHFDGGMGLAFQEIVPQQRLVLEGWLAEILTTLGRLRGSYFGPRERCA